MISRRSFLSGLAVLPLGNALARANDEGRISTFSKRLRPVGRVLEEENWYVWGTSPIQGPDGRIHVFYSRWPAERRMGGWINRSEIAHAVAERPEGPYTYVETVLAPRGTGYWDGTTCHNPHIQKVGDRYALFYMGNSNGKTGTKRVGLALAESLDGPWTRSDQPLLQAGPEGAWDDHCTSNPAFVRHPNGEYWLYFKSWNTKDYENAADPTIRGNRKIGLAVAKSLDGPYIRYEGNPIIDYSARGPNTQLEDPYVWFENGLFRMVARDMGIYGHEQGLYLESRDGIHWSDPQIAYQPVRQYVQEPPGAAHLKKYGRLERPQLLLQGGKPTYLFTASQGGRYMNSSAFVFKLA